MKVPAINLSLAKELVDEAHKAADKDTWKIISARFFKIMRKYGIKLGTKRGKGIDMANFEWTLYSNSCG